MPSRKKRIGILTGGGDCPGLNAAIRAVVKTAILDYGMEVFGIKDGYIGLIENIYSPLSYQDVSGILTEGGTFLGASNKANPFKYPTTKNRLKDVSGQVLRNAKKMGLDGLICIGGDGTLSIAYSLYKKGLNLVGIPKTIDKKGRSKIAAQRKYPELNFVFGRCRSPHLGCVDATLIAGYGLSLIKGEIK